MVDIAHGHRIPDAELSATAGPQEMGYVRKAVVLSLMLVLSVGCFVVLRPFVAAILWAAILTFSTWPLHQRLERALGGRTTLASALMTAMVTLLLVGPLVLLGARLSDHALRLFEAVHSSMERELPPLPAWLAGIPLAGERLQEVWQAAAAGEGSLRALLEPHLGRIRDGILEAGGALMSGTALMAISVFIAFFLYRDGRAGVRRLRSTMGSIAGARARQSLDVAGDTINSVVHGVLGTALVQAVAAAVGYWIADVPGAFLLGFVTFFLSLVPMGPAVLWVPAAVWLAARGETGTAVFVVLWVGVLVGSLDNILRPILIGRRSDLPFIIIFLGIVGGLMAFGLLGIFLGPTLLAVAYGLVREWSGGERGEPLPE